jgi:type VI secretion system protein ImpA
MSEEKELPAVIDLEVLLKPVSDDAPSGESLRYSGLYDEINEARRQDDDLNQGAWQTDLKVADYRRVIGLAVPALETQTKDLQVAVWLCEALVKEHGFVGLRDGIRLLVGLQRDFWDTLHPEIDEGDMEGRANAISWFDANVAFAAKGAPFTGHEGYGLIHYEDSKTFDFPENIEGLPSAEREKLGKLKAQAEAERRVTGEMWRKEATQTSRAHCEKVNDTIQAIWADFKDLNAVIEEKFDRNQTPGLSGFRKTMESIEIEFKKLLEQKRVEEPDAVEEEAEESETVSADGTVVVAKGGGGGPIQTRRDALKRLEEVANYFQRNEPHSPVAYLIQRAVKWGNMPLEHWLRDVIKDENVISQIRQTLGFNTISDAPAAPPGQPAPAAPPPAPPPAPESQ